MAVGDLRKIDARSQVKHTRHWLWYISAISFVTGALLATSIRTQKVIGKEFADRGVSFRPNALGERLKAAWGEIKDQREMIAQKNVEIASLLNQLKDQEPNTRKIIEEIERYKVLMGQTEMTGPGIVLTLSDSKMSTQVRPEDVEQFILHDYDIQRVVNELRVAGAEVISINGQRVVERTAIRCVGPVAHVNNSPVTSPFVITAIGDPEVLYGGLMIANGIVDWLRSLTFPVTVEKRAHLRVPAYSGSVQLRNARPVVPAPPRPAASEGEGKS